MIVLTLTAFAILSFKSISATDTCPEGVLIIRGVNQPNVQCTDAQGCKDCEMTLSDIDLLQCGNFESCFHVEASIYVGPNPLKVECGGKYSCAQSTVKISCDGGSILIKCTAEHACSGSKFIIDGCDVNGIECAGNFACADSTFTLSDPDTTISCEDEDDATVCNGLQKNVLDHSNGVATDDTKDLDGLCCACTAAGPGMGYDGCEEDPDCVDTVCLIDDFCCNFEWDTTCGDVAKTICFANTAAPVITTPAATTAAPIITTPAATTAAPVITTPAATTAPIVTTAAATTAPVITDVVSDDDDGDDDIDDDDDGDVDDGDDVDDDDDDDDGDDIDDGDDDSVDDSSSLANVGDISKWSELTTAEAASSVWAIVGYIGLFIVICVVCVLFVIPVYKRHREGLHKGNTKDFVDSTDNVLAVVADGDDDTATGLTQNP